MFCINLSSLLFLGAAIYLIFIGLNFIGISYIIVYIGAITVLFLFVVMMINVSILDIAPKNINNI